MARDSRSPVAVVMGGEGEGIADAAGSAAGVVKALLRVDHSSRNGPETEPEPGDEAIDLARFAGALQRDHLGRGAGAVVVGKHHAGDLQRPLVRARDIARPAGGR